MVTDVSVRFRFPVSWVPFKFVLSFLWVIRECDKIMETFTFGLSQLTSEKPSFAPKRNVIGKLSLLEKMYWSRPHFRALTSTPNHTKSIHVFYRLHKKMP